jgi:hypothetical protein
MALLFAVTAVVVLASGDSTGASTVALLGWYLMARGAADVVVSTLTRETDRIWGLLMVIGVLETGLGFFAASPLSRASDLALTVLGGLALLRGVADLVTALRLREIAAARADVLDLPPERAAGVAGYAAGHNDYEAAPGRTGPRHRASSKGRPGIPPDLPSSFRESDLPSSFRESAQPSSFRESAQPSSFRESAQPSSFHDEVLRASADLDSMLALAGVTGAAVGAGLAEYHDIPEVPDTPEGVELQPEINSEPAAAARPETPAAG